MKWALVVVVFDTMPLKTGLTLNSRRVLDGRRGNAGGLRSRVQPLALWDEEQSDGSGLPQYPAVHANPGSGWKIVGRAFPYHVDRDH
jgi:hypothetical protein